MSTKLLAKLEQKVHQAVEVIELLRMQIEELEEENLTLKAEQEKWRQDLCSLLKRFDEIEIEERTEDATELELFNEEELEDELEDELYDEDEEEEEDDEIYDQSEEEYLDEEELEKESN